MTMIGNDDEEDGKLPATTDNMEEAAAAEAAEPGDATEESGPETRKAVAPKLIPDKASKKEERKEEEGEGAVAVSPMKERIEDWKRRVSVNAQSLRDSAVEQTQKVKESAAEQTQKFKESAAEQTQRLKTATVEGPRRCAAHVSQSTQRCTTNVSQSTQRCTTNAVQSTQRCTTNAVQSTQRAAHDAASRVGRAASKAAKDVAETTQKVVPQFGAHPLELDHSGGGGDGGEYIVRGSQNDICVTGVPSPGVQALAFLALLSSLLVITMVDQQLVSIQTFLTALLTPLVYWQKEKLFSLRELRDRQTELRPILASMRATNRRLKGNIHQLQEHQDRLHHVEPKLLDVANAAGTRIDALVDLIHQMQEAQENVDNALKGRVVQELFTAMMDANYNAETGQLVLAHPFVVMLEKRLAGMPGIAFNVDSFRAILSDDDDDEKELALPDVLAIARNMESMSDENRIFFFVPQKILQQDEALPQDEGGKLSDAKEGLLIGFELPSGANLPKNK